MSAAVAALRPAVDAPARSPAAADAPVVLEADRVEKTYPNGTHALNDTSVQIQRGEFVSLLGPSGCGKSTLLKMFAGLEVPSSGRIVLHDGHDAAGRASGHRSMAMVFQEATLMPWARVAENVRLPLDLAGMPRIEADERVQRALDLVGLRDFAHVYPRELSGGMQMRASIARALVTAPDLLLMDEPFGALDEITRGRLDRELRELWERERLTVLFVTHSLDEAVFLSTRVLVMSPRPGRIVGEVVIDEPHPRADAFRTSQRFAAWCSRLQDMLAADETSADRGAHP